MVPEISPELEQILLKVLAKEPSQRYRTADQLGRVLMNFGANRSDSFLPLAPEATPTIDMEASSKPNLEPLVKIDWFSVGLGLMALVAVLGLIPFWMWVYFVYNPPIR
jgi:hypothetical protein